jgi:hypothetical protein
VRRGGKKREGRGREVNFFRTYQSKYETPVHDVEKVVHEIGQVLVKISRELLCLIHSCAEG